MTRTARLTEGELERVLETVGAWGAVVEDVGPNDVGINLGTRPGFAYLDEDSAVVAQVVMAMPSTAEPARRWIQHQTLPGGLSLALETPAGDEDEEAFLLWLRMGRPLGEPLPQLDVRPVVAKLGHSWFAYVGDEELARLHDVLTAMGLATTTSEGRELDFSLTDADGFAYVKDSGDRARIHLFLGHDVYADEAEAWIQRQPDTSAGQLQVVGDPTEPQSQHLRFTTERPLDPARISNHDAYAGQGERFAVAWQTRDLASLEPWGGSTLSPVVGPVTIEPANAWLLYGDEASFPSEDDLARARDEANGQIYDYLWTAAKQTQPGDLLLLYFVHERKAVHFVARAAAAAWFSGDIEVTANSRVRRTQWWTYITPPVAIEPISFARLKMAFNDDLVMRGRSGRYIPPTTANRLIDIVRSENPATELQGLLRNPTGLADLPAPARTTFEQWRVIASGSLPLEANVEERLVEPLLRLALEDQSAFRVQKRLPVAGGVADYAILSDAGPAAVVEVKVSIRKRPNMSWADSPDFRQTRRYADALGCPSVLIDSNFVHLIATGADAPYRSIERRTANLADLHALSQHVSTVA